MDPIAYHRKVRGKVEMRGRVRIRTKRDLATVYTPGVAVVSRAIAENPSLVFDVTNRGNTVAIVSDGTAVLGLGNVGPEAALPVMEGKALIMKEFAGIDAIPLCIETRNPDEVVAFCKALVPTVGGILLEDIKAPECFAVESRLQDLGIPVVHDDQHGTSIVILAALKNALKVVSKKLERVKIVISGGGAAGIASGKLLRDAGCRNLVMCDSKGIISTSRTDLSEYKKLFAVRDSGSLADALKSADVFIGVSAADILTSAMVGVMAKDPIVFAMANPDPEISPEEAGKADIAVYATGRSDLPNQVNNALVFPGLFKGLLAARSSKLTAPLKLTIAETLSALVPDPSPRRILPDVFDSSVVPSLALAIAKGELSVPSFRPPKVLVK